MARPDDRPASPWARLRDAAAIAAAVTTMAAAVVPAAVLASPSPAAHPAQASDLPEGEEEEGGDETWEAEIPEGDGGWIELEEELEDEELGEGAGSSLPPECVLRTVHPEAVLDPTHEKLRLTLRYTARSPTRAGLDLGLRGGRGSLQLGTAKRQLGRSGVVRLGRHLDPGALEKARSARAIVVGLDVPAAPSSCRSRLTLRLSAKQVIDGRATWSVPAARS